MISNKTKSNRKYFLDMCKDINRHPDFSTSTYEVQPYLATCGENALPRNATRHKLFVFPLKFEVVRIFRAKYFQNIRDIFKIFKG